MAADIPRMKPCIFYFSRTGNTKRLAEAIAEQINAPIFSISSIEPSAVEAYDTVILGTPVEGAKPALETTAFVGQLPKGQGKKVVIFCTYRLFGNERTMKILEKALVERGYETILKFSKKGMKSGQPADFSELLGKVKSIF